MNKRRKINKAKKMWDYYYNKDNNLKAINNYLRYIKLRNLNEIIYFKLSSCYVDIWNLEEALFYVNKWLKISCWDYDLIDLKWKILLDLWQKEESKIYLDKIKLIDKNNNEAELDLDKFYGKK